MQVSLGLRHLVGMLLVVLLGNGIALSQQPSAGTAAAGQSQLKWTPHRAATSTEPTASPTPEDTASQSAATAAAAATPATAVAPATTLPAIPPKTALAQPPASVGLPAGVPAVSTAQ